MISKFNFFLSLILLLVLSNNNTNAQIVDEIIAKVDNQIILKSELEMGYLQFLKNDQGINDVKDLKCKVLESLIINKLLVAKAEIDSVVIEKSVVDDQLTRRMQYFIEQAGSEKKLEELYGKSLNILKEELRKQVKEQMLIQKMQDNITAKVKVTPSEVKKYFNEIPKDSLPFFSTEVEVGQIVKYPQVNREQKLAARQKLEEIKEKVINGEDFCKYALEFSEDPGSAKECGELGFFKKGELVPPYESAALKLKPGGYAIVETEYGFHLVQLIERRANEINTRHILIKPVASGKYTGNFEKSVEANGTQLNGAEKLLDSLRHKIEVDSIDFQNAALKFSDDKMTKANGGFFQDSKTGTSKISLENVDPSVFFMIDTMQVGTLSMALPYKTEDDKDALRIIYYKSKTAPHQANLKDDYQKIYKAALNEKKNKALGEWFDKTKGEIFIDIDEEYKDCQILIAQ